MQCKGLFGKALAEVSPFSQTGMTRAVSDLYQLEFGSPTVPRTPGRRGQPFAAMDLQYHY